MLREPTGHPANCAPAGTCNFKLLQGSHRTSQQMQAQLLMRELQLICARGWMRRDRQHSLGPPKRPLAARAAAPPRCCSAAFSWRASWNPSVWLVCFETIQSATPIQCGCVQVLADIVESLTGAIFLDSNKCVVSYAWPTQFRRFHSRRHMFHAGRQAPLDLLSCELRDCCHA